MTGSTRLKEGLNMGIGAIITCPRCFAPADPDYCDRCHWGSRYATKIRKEVHDKEHVVVMKVAGKLTIDGGDLQLREAITETLGWNVVLDLTGMVDDVDSSGLGELTALYTRLAGTKHGLRLLNPPKKLLAVLQLTKLRCIFGEVYTSEKEAIASFDEPRSNPSRAHLCP